MALARVPKFIGVCVRAGTMDKAIKVRTAKQKLDPFLQKHFKIWPTYIVQDPYNSCRTGDVVRFQQFPTGSRSKRIRHAVTEILAAFGPRLEDRPPVMSEEEQKEKLRVVAERQQRRRDTRMDAKQAAALTRMSKRKKNFGEFGTRSQDTDVVQKAEAKLIAVEEKFEKSGVVRPVKRASSNALLRDKKATREYWEGHRARDSQVTSIPEASPSPE